MDMNFEDQVTDPRGFGGAPDPEVETDEDGAIPATEEEQMDYDLLVVRARKMIFGKGREDILTMMGASESPAQAMGQAGALLIKAMLQSAKDQGREIEGDVAINAAPEIVEDLNELGKANGVFTYDTPEDEEQELADAMLWGVKYYGDGMVKGGEISPEMQKMAQQQVQEGLASEGAEPGPQKTPIAAGVEQAVAPGGMVAGAMNGGM